MHVYSKYIYARYNNVDYTRLNIHVYDDIHIRTNMNSTIFFNLLRYNQLRSITQLIYYLVFLHNAKVSFGTLFSVILCLHCCHNDRGDCILPFYSLLCCIFEGCHDDGGDCILALYSPSYCVCRVAMTMGVIAYWHSIHHHVVFAELP